MFLILIKKFIAKKRLNNFNKTKVIFVDKSLKVLKIAVLNSFDNEILNQELHDELKILLSREISLETMTFVQQSKKILNSESFFSEKSFSFMGEIKDQNLIDFVNQPFDLLINFYETDNIFLDLASYNSKALFKVGLNLNGLNVNDFVIEGSINQPKEFVFELQKYMKLMNKI